MPVLRYPQIRESPNSGGSRFQPMPILGNATVEGCPDFPGQDEAAYFNVCLVQALGGSPLAYADTVEREMNQLRLQPFKESIETAAKNFARQIAPPPKPTPISAPASPATAAQPQVAATTPAPPSSQQQKRGGGK